MTRIRHCVECPNCRLRYIVASSPYSNGARLLPLQGGSADHYLLYWSCATPPMITLCKSSEIARYSVSTNAYMAGYGNSEEIASLAITRRVGRSSSN
jgi:hypothetical protein